MEGGCKISQILLAGKSWKNYSVAFQWKDEPKGRTSSQQTKSQGVVLRSWNVGREHATWAQRIPESPWTSNSFVLPVAPFELLPCHCISCVCGWVTGVFTFTDQLRGAPQTSSPTPAPQRIWVRGLLLAWWLGSAWAQAWLMALGSSPNFPP